MDFNTLTHAQVQSFLSFVSHEFYPQLIAMLEDTLDITEEQMKLYPQNVLEDLSAMGQWRGQVKIIDFLKSLPQEIGEFHTQKYTNSVERQVHEHGWKTEREAESLPHKPPPYRNNI